MNKKLNYLIVIGGAGFIGSNLIKLLLKKTKKKIISLDNYSTGLIKNHIKHKNVYYKKENSQNISLSDINIEEISLLDEKHYQHKIIKDNKIIFQIIDIENDKIKREIIIEK